MDVLVKEGKILEDILKEIENELNISSKDYTYKTETKKAGLFKGEVTVVSAIKYTDVAETAKEFLQDILSKMGLNVTFEIKVRDNQINIKMYSDKNNILIGKNGQTLASLQTIIRQVINAKSGVHANIVLDVENYKDKQAMHLERLAKNVAREVYQTKIEVSLENMNSYERRVIHSILSEDKRVYTESVGEEPNRHIVVKPKN